MTPKEKAEELFGNFYYIIPSYELPIDDQVAKECALITVDEILDVFLPCYPSQREFNEFINYWIEVKQEIKKL